MKKGGPKARVVQYYLSVHFGLCHGPVSKIWRILIGEKEAWQGPRTESGLIPVSAPDLFGGPQKEGGVSGLAHFLFGESDQVLPDGLAQRLGRPDGASCPGFRGITSIFMYGGGSAAGEDVAPGAAGFMWGANVPYLKPFWVEMTRIGNEWYPEQAEIIREIGGDPPYDSFAFLAGVTGNTWWKFDTYGKYAVRAEVLTDWQRINLLTQAVDEFPRDYINAFGCHLTKTGQVCIRDGQDDKDFYFYNIHTGALDQVVTHADTPAVGNIAADDIIMPNGTVVMIAAQQDVLGSNSLHRFRFNGTWEVEQCADNIADPLYSMSVGKKYAYALVGEHWVLGAGFYTEVALIDLSDLSYVKITPPGLSETIAACYYDKTFDRVVIICVNAHIFLYDAELTTQLAANTSAEVLAAVNPDGLLSKRMSPFPGIVGYRNDGTGDNNNKIYLFGLPSLDLIRIVDPVEEVYPWSAQAFGWDAFNQEYGFYLGFSHFFNQVAWSLPVGDRPDMNPAHIIYELLTNTSWGLSMPPTSIDLDALEYAADLLAGERFGLSFLWNKQDTVEAIIQEVLDHIEAVIFINPQTGLLTLKLIRDDYDVEDIPSLTEDECRITKFQRKSWGDTVNEIVVSWTNPDSEETETITAQNDGNVAKQGGIVSDSRNYYMVRSPTLAQRLLVRDLRTASIPLISVELRVNRAAWDFKPGDVFKLSSVEYGFTDLVLRVGTVDYGRPGDPEIVLTCIEDVFAYATTDFTAQPPETEWDPEEEDPEPMEYSEGLTLPYYMLARRVGTDGFEDPEVGIGILAAQTGVDTRAYTLWGPIPSTTGTTRGSLGVRTTLARGVLEAALLAEVESEVLLANLGTLSRGEGITVGGFALVGVIGGGVNTYEMCLVTALTGTTVTLQRGILDTVPVEHDVGEEIWFFTSAANIFDPYLRSVSEEISYQLLSRTTLGQLPLGEAPILKVTATDRPYLPTRPANVEVEGIGLGNAVVDLTAHVGATFDVDWVRRNRLTEDSQVLRWDDADISPEATQTTKIQLLNQLDRSLIDEYTGLAGTTHAVTKADFGGELLAILRVVAELGSLESLQGFEIKVRITNNNLRREDDSMVEEEGGLMLEEDGGEMYEEEESLSSPTYILREDGSRFQREG